MVERLSVTIEFMQILPASSLTPIMDWLCALPYPWCPAQCVLAGAPPLDGLEPVRIHIGRK
jgi:hypothetical protein